MDIFSSWRLQPRERDEDEEEEEEEEKNQVMQKKRKATVRSGKNNKASRSTPKCNV